MARVIVGVLSIVMAVGTGNWTGVTAAETTVEVSKRTLVSVPNHRMGEFAVARNPRNPDHLVVAAMDFDDQTGSVGCATFVSRDGGLRWRPGKHVPGLDKGFVCGDPWVTIDTQGRAHLQGLLIDGTPADYVVGQVDGSLVRATPQQIHARSDDGGHRWSPARRIPPRHKKNQVDKNAIHASRSGTLFACINELPEGGDDLVVSRSFDAGSSWTRPKALDEAIGIDGPDDNGPVKCNGIAEGPNGEIHVMWMGWFPGESTPRFGTATTRDDGATWTGTTIDQVRLEYDNPAIDVATLNLGWTWPSIAASPVNGEVFVSVPRFSGDRYVSVLYRSNNSGRSYEEVSLPEIPSRGCGECHQMRPALVVDDSGRLGLQLMLTSNELGLDKEAWFLISPDGGDSWLQPIQLSSTGPDRSYLDPRNWAPDGARSSDQVMDALQHPDRIGATLGWDAIFRARRTDQIRWGGDYWGITASSKGFVALWEDHWANGKHQLWSRVIRVGDVDNRELHEVSGNEERGLLLSSLPLPDQIMGSEKCKDRPLTPRVGDVPPVARGVIDVIDRKSRSRLLSVNRKSERMTAVLDSSDTVLETIGSYREILSRQGFEMAFLEYEGFEAELLGFRDETTVLARILEGCSGSSAVVTLHR